MTLGTLSDKDRTTLIAGACMIATLVLVSRGVPAWIRWQRHVRDDAITASQEATASQRTVQMAPVLARTAQQLERRYFALAPAFLPGERPAVTGAALITTVTAAARMAGMRLGALQVESDTTGRPGVVPVRVRGDGSGDITGITHFLSAIESGVPLLSVRELSLTPIDPHAASDTPETIQVNFVIEGLARSDENDDDGHGSE
jgi:Type II secretion system (T2SS), protein M subtype b